MIKEQANNFIQDINEDKLMELIEGKKVDGFKLSKDQ